MKKNGANKARNQLLETKLSGHTKINYTYDHHGNMKALPHLQWLEWNHQDELVRVKLDLSGNLVHYNYDGGGQRTRKTITKNGLKQKERLYLGLVERYQEYDNNGVVTLERWTLQVEGLAQVDTLTVRHAVGLSSPTPVARYQYRDRLGSSTIEANELGQVISYEEYYPYGASAYRAAASGVDLSLKRYRFTGKERDEETGLDYFGVRYYASWLGRWTSADPGGFVDGLNLYRYVRNNPVNGVDALGYQTDPPEYEQALQNAIEFYGSQGYDINANIAHDLDGNVQGNISITNGTETINTTYDNGSWTTTITTVHIQPDGDYPGVSTVEQGDGLLLSLRTIGIEEVVVEATGIEPEVAEEITPWNTDAILDGIQLGLGVIGMIPLAGEVADLLDAGISALRGDWVGVGLSLAAMIPILGWASGAGKIGQKAVKLYDEVIEFGSKVADDIASIGRGIADDFSSAWTNTKNIFNEALGSKQLATPPGTPPLKGGDDHIMKMSDDPYDEFGDYGSKKKNKRKKKTDMNGFKPLKEKAGNKYAKKAGFEDAHDFKDTVIPGDVMSHWNMTFNNKTKELGILHKTNNVHIQTGYFIK